MRGRQPRAHLVPAADQLVRQHQGARREHRPGGARQRRPLDPEHRRRRRQRHLALQGQPADLRAGGARHHRLRRAERRRSPWTGRSTTGSASPSALAGQERYVIVNIGNEPFGNNELTPPGPTDNANAIKRLRGRRVRPTRSWWTRRTGVRTGRSPCATTRPSVFAADPQTQHRLLDPHVRRVRHRRRDQRLPGPVPHRQPADRGRRVRLQPLRRQPRRGHHPVVHPGQRDRLPRLVVERQRRRRRVPRHGHQLQPGQPDHLGPADLQRRQRHPADLAARRRVYGGTTPTTPPTTPPTDSADHPADHASPTTPPTTTPPATGGCTATYTITGQWQGGFQGEVG